MRKDAGPHGEDVSVPINVAYNHHHGVVVCGKGARMETMDKIEADMAGLHGLKLSEKDKLWVPVEHTRSSSGAPTSAVFDDGNGGEFRKTYHGYAPPFAQLVESPTTLSGTAMQIDTWHRDKMNLTGSPFVSGPTPKNALQVHNQSAVACELWIFFDRLL